MLIAHLRWIAFAYIGNPIYGKTGGTPQALFPHIALNCFYGPFYVILLLLLAGLTIEKSTIASDMLTTSFVPISPHYTQFSLFTETCVHWGVDLFGDMTMQSRT